MVTQRVIYYTQLDLLGWINLIPFVESEIEK
jgi:hypothetical protein